MYRVATSAIRLPPTTSRPGPTFRVSVSRLSRGVPCAPSTAAEEPGEAAPGAIEPCACVEVADGAGDAPPVAAAGFDTINRMPRSVNAFVTGWKNVVPPWVQSPLPP